MSVFRGDEGKGKTFRFDRIRRLPHPPAFSNGLEPTVGSTLLGVFLVVGCFLAAIIGTVRLLQWLGLA